MQELEKILEEIDAHAIEFEAFGVSDEYISINWVKDIIRKHMDDCWIPVECPPKEGGKDTWYLIQVIGGKKPYMILNYHTEYELFGEIERDRFLGDHISGTAYKWRPLPDPYRPERSEGE